MSSILPSSITLRKQVEAYVKDTRRIVETCIRSAESRDPFAKVYNTSLATDTVLSSLSVGLVPSVASARAIVLRIPLLTIIGQTSAAHAELRRFVELLLWSLYFTDHPIEWKEFTSNPGGFSRDSSRPISFAAHRELNFYLAYARELMGNEPSGIALNAVAQIESAKKTLNASVHAGHLARSKAKLAPYDSVADKEIKNFERLQRSTFANCCIVLGAYRRTRFDKMTAISRAYFDILVGSVVRKQIRSGPFGLP